MDVDMDLDVDMQHEMNMNYWYMNFMNCVIIMNYMNIINLKRSMVTDTDKDMNTDRIKYSEMSECRIFW
jgi:hypothetical protein